MLKKVAIKWDFSAFSHYFKGIHNHLLSAATSAANIRTTESYLIHTARMHIHTLE